MTWWLFFRWLMMTFLHSNISSFISFHKKNYIYWSIGIHFFYVISWFQIIILLHFYLDGTWYAPLPKSMLWMLSFSFPPVEYAMILIRYSNEYNTLTLPSCLCSAGHLQIGSFFSLLDSKKNLSKVCKSFVKTLDNNRQQSWQKDILLYPISSSFNIRSFQTWKGQLEVQMTIDC